jgi:hypothetical protein
MAPASPKRSPKRKRKSGDETSGNQGEGNRGADRRYRKKAADFAKSNRADPAAEEARRSVEEGARDAGVGDELDQLERNKRALREDLGDKPPRGRAERGEG